MASLIAQLVKNLPAMWETWVQSLVWEDPLEKGKATHSSILAWRIPCTVWFMGSQRVGHDWVTFTFTINSIYIDLAQERKDYTKYGDYTDLAHKRGLWLVLVSIHDLLIGNTVMIFMGRKQGLFDAYVTGIPCHLPSCWNTHPRIHPGNTGYWFS